jgi:peptidoglycan/LPS O-acetylase OafA/YrhL
MSSVCEISANRLACLDGFRGLAAVWVMLAHCGIWGGANVLHLPSPKLAVDLFMVLSGFLMMHNYGNLLERGDGNWRTAVMQFYGRRFFRLAPLYYAVLAALFLWGRPMLDGYSTLRELNPEIWRGKVVYDPARLTLDASNFLWHVSFLFGLSPTGSFSTMLPDWSLSLEMQFYTFFPLLLLLVRRITLVAVGGVALLLAILSTRIIGKFYEPSLLAFSLHTFIAGMLLSVASRAGGRTEEKIAAAALAMLLSGWNGRLILPLIALLLLCVMSDGTVRGSGIKTVRALFSCRPARFVGDVSFAIYLVHGAVIAVAGSRLLQWSALSAWSKPEQVGLMTLVVAVVTLPLAWLLHVLIEKPGINLGKRVLSKACN